MCCYCCTEVHYSLDFSMSLAQPLTVNTVTLSIAENMADLIDGYYRLEKGNDASVIARPNKGIGNVTVKVVFFNMNYLNSSYFLCGVIWLQSIIVSMRGFNTDCSHGSYSDKVLWLCLYRENSLISLMYADGLFCIQPWWLWMWPTVLTFSLILVSITSFYF